MAKVVYFIRHGEAAFNLLDRVNAHPEVVNDLTVTGREQAACCAREVAAAGIAAIHCSAFPRARQTAEIVNAKIGAPLFIDPRINETGAFAFEGKPCAAWHRAQIPERLTAVVPGCEPFSEMKARLAAFLDDLRGMPEEVVAVVSHEEPIQVMIGILAGLDDATAKTSPISHCLPFKAQL